MATAKSTRAPSLNVGERHGIAYKWIVLSNTTLGMLIASIDGTILIIALPAVFRGIHVDPLASGQTGLLLWVLLGFNVATTILLVAFGRISDTFGRVRMYNAGFAVFTIGSILLSLTWSHGVGGEWELIVFRFLQGIGGAFLFSNSGAIITDAFPANERGLALGLNQLVAIGGSVVGVVVGGLLAAVDWRLVFWVNVPVGLAGTIWAYIALRETSRPKKALRIDWLGNLSFAIGLLGVLIGLTYSIQPYHGHGTGWHNPFVLVSLFGGIALLIVFTIVERYAREPMFHLGLFRSWAFSAGNLASLLSAIARGGLAFMIIIWLQGIWLPLHGVSYTQTPLQAGLDTLPQMFGFVAAGPLSGRLSDRFGARWFGFAGMLVAAAGFLLLRGLPVDFHYWTFAFDIFVIGVGMGLFAAPNSAAIMNSVPARYRGVASGMRATFMNAGQMLSMGIFFTILITALTQRLPRALFSGLIAAHVPKVLALKLSGLPPIAALFASLLGYNPMQHMLAGGISLLPKATVKSLTGHAFFPDLIGPPFMHALGVVFLFSMIMSLVAAVMSALRGTRYVYQEEEEVSSPKLQALRLVAMVAVAKAHQGAARDLNPDAQARLRRALALLLLVEDATRSRPTNA